MTQLTRTQYKQARRLLRANGQYALRCMDLSTRAAMELVIDAAIGTDRLALRQAFAIN